MLSRLSAVAAGLALVMASSAAYASGAHEGGRCSGGAFSGSYVGVNLGYASGNTDMTSADPADPKLSKDDGSFTIGAHSGYNIQCDRTVFGIESDFGYLGLETSGTFAPNAPTVSVKSEMNWFSTTRARLGILLRDDMLAYVTGGLAMADIDHKLFDSAVPFRQSNGGTKYGWTLGGGVEFMRDNRWTFRAEALYVDLGDETHSYTYTGGPCIGICTGRVKWEDDFWVARVGFSYKFNFREEHIPLK